jgi:ApbE superfamily uncharacterized protein (UPF0280 family)
MDTPYLGAGIRNFGESREALIESGHPMLAAALQTAPAFVATLAAPEARAAARTVGKGMIENAMAPRAVGPMASQRGFIAPQSMAAPLGRAFRFSRAAKSASGALAGERTAQTVGKALEGTHKATVAEKTATAEHDSGKGRNLLAKH